MTTPKREQTKATIKYVDKKEFLELAGEIEKIEKCKHGKHPDNKECSVCEYDKLPTFLYDTP